MKNKELYYHLNKIQKTIDRLKFIAYLLSTFIATFTLTFFFDAEQDVLGIILAIVIVSGFLLPFMIPLFKIENIINNDIAHGMEEENIKGLLRGE